MCKEVKTIAVGVEISAWGESQLLSAYKPPVVNSLELFQDGCLTFHCLSLWKAILSFKAKKYLWKDTDT